VARRARDARAFRARPRAAVLGARAVDPDAGAGATVVCEPERRVSTGLQGAALPGEMPMSEDLLTAIDGAVARITFNRPEARNAVNQGMIAAMHRFLQSIEHDRRVR